MAQAENGIWDSLRDRWEFATKNDEQRYQTRLYSDRRLYNQILSYPSNYIQNRLLRPDIKPKGLFDQAAAFTFVDKWLFGSMAGMVARSMTSGYAKHQNYLRAREAATSLAGMAMAAEALQPDHKLSEEIAAGQGSLIHTLFEQSAEAGHVLEQFISGSLPITPSNIEKLTTLFASLAELSATRAEQLAAYQALAQRPEAGKPADYIREVVQKPELETLRDAQVFMGYVSALLADSSVPFSSELYIPQEEVFLTESQNKELSKAISERLAQLGYRVNQPVEEGGALPAPDRPEGMLLKQGAEGLVPLSETEILSFAREMHRNIGALMGKDMARMLDFADARFDDIQNTLAHRKAAALATVKPELALNPAPQVSAAPTPQNYGNGNLLARDAQRLAAAAKGFMTRPHIDTEVSKLWGRSITNQILAFPVNIFDEVLRNFFKDSQPDEPKAGFDVMVDRLRGNKDSEMQRLFDSEAFKNNLKSRGFRLFSQSLIASVGVVYSQQSTRVGAMLAVDAAKRSDPLLTAAIRHGQQFVPEFAERVEKVKGQHPSLTALLQHPDYKERIPAMLSGRAEAMSAEDFRLLSQFFHDMSRVSVSMAEEVLAPFQQGTSLPQKVQPMDEVVARLFGQPVTTMPDAMMALAFTQGFMQLSREQVEMIEYVDPSGVMINVPELKRMGYFIQDEAKRLGLRVSETGGQTQLVSSDGRPATPEAVIALGQAAIGRLGTLVNLPMLLGAAKGDFRDRLVEQMEQRLFDGVHFATKAADAPRPAAAPQSEPWAEKVARPVTGPLSNIARRWKHPEVRHERQKLFDRLQGEKLTSTVSTLIQKSLQHRNKLTDRGNLIYTAWTYFAYPTIYGKWLVDVREVWDELLFRKRSMLNDAEQAAGLAAAAVMAAGVAQPELKERLSDFMTSNLLVEEMEGDFHNRDIARIAAKPLSERSPQDDAVMEDYFQRSGDRMLRLTGQMLGHLGGHEGRESFREVILRVCDAPVTSVADAMVGLSFLASVVARDADFLNRQTFVDPRERMLQKDELKALGGFISDQAYAAGFVVNGQELPGSKAAPVRLDGVPDGVLLEKTERGYQPASGESLIRFANVALGRFREIREQSPQTAKAFDHLLREDKQQRLVLAAKDTAAAQLR